MPDFPLLKTAAIAQYPAERILTQSSRVFRFLDNSEQSFRVQPAPTKRWVVDLALLDEGEATRLSAFFEAQNGQLRDFSFIDPWDGTDYPSCRLESDVLAEHILGEGRASMRLVIRENRS